MAEYLILAPSFLTERGVSDPRTYKPGEVVRYDGEPGSGMYPLNAEARARRAAVLKRRYPHQRERDALLVQRARRGLTGSTRARLDQAIAEMEAFPNE